MVHHNHTGGGCGHEQCDHGDPEEEDFQGWSLYGAINHARVSCLNAQDVSVAADILKPHSERFDFTVALESNRGDPELLLFVPFTHNVKIKSICVLGGDDGTAPDKLKTFLNRDDIDFSIAADLTPTQEWTLSNELTSTLEYPTKYFKFQSVHSITLYFPSNYAGSTTRVFYVGFKGERTQIKRVDKVTNVVYELRPQMQDHKAGNTEKVSRMIE